MVCCNSWALFLHQGKPISALGAYQKGSIPERRLVMKKLVMVALASALLLTVLASLPRQAAASSTVGTYTVADLVQTHER